MRTSAACAEIECSTTNLACWADEPGQDELGRDEPGRVYLFGAAGQPLLSGSQLGDQASGVRAGRHERIAPPPEHTPTLAVAVTPVPDPEPDTELFELVYCPTGSGECDGCGRPLRLGWPVRLTSGTGAQPYMCPPCWWSRWRAEHTGH